MAEMLSKDDQVPSPATTTSATPGVAIPNARESVDNSTSNTSGSVSPKLPIARIFSRSRSTSQQSHSNKEDSDETSQSLSESDREKKKEKGDKWQFFGPKPKSGSGWINLPFAFTMSHREKNAEIHKIFSQLPASEKLIDDYSCALQRDILVHGRLYVTQNWLCFYANIFAWETLLTIPFRTVVSITKERTALLIPNAIQISTTVEKYGFSSFIQRDVTYNIMFKVWQNSLLESPQAPIDLVKAARKAWGDSTDIGSQEDLWGSLSSGGSGSSPKTHRHSMPTHLEIGQITTTSTSPLTSRGGTSNAAQGKHNRPPPLTSVAKSLSAVETTSSTYSNPVATALDDATPKGSRASQLNKEDEEESSTGGSSGANRSIEANKQDGASEVMNQSKSPARGQDGGVGESGGDNSSAEFEAHDFPDQGEIPCECPEHTGRTILNDIYNAEVENIFQLLFTDSDFYRSFLKSRKTTNIEISEWSTQGDGTRLRDISYTLSLNYSFGPKFSSCTEHQVYFKNGQPGVKHIVQTDVINGNVPYGDAFYVSCRFCMTRVAHNRTRLRVTSNICFKKNCWGVVKNLIERNAGDGLRSYYSHLDTALKEHLASLPARRLQKTTKRSSRRRHRRMSSVQKEDDGHASTTTASNNVASSVLRKRGGSMSSRISLKSVDSVPLEKDVVKEPNKELKRVVSIFHSLPQVNLALTVLLGLLVIFNMILYHQLMIYQSTPSSTGGDSLAVPNTKMPSRANPTTDDEIEWPNSPEEWKNLFKEYWEHDQEDKRQIATLLQGVADTLEQVEKAISATRSHLQSKANTYGETNRASGTPTSRNKIKQ